MRKVCTALRGACSARLIPIWIWQVKTYIWTANSNNQKQFIRNTVHQKHFESFRTAHFASETVVTVDKLNQRWDRWAALCILTVFHKCPKMLWNVAPEDIAGHLCQKCWDMKLYPGLISIYDLVLFFGLSLLVRCSICFPSRRGKWTLKSIWKIGPYTCGYPPLNSISCTKGPTCV